MAVANYVFALFSVLLGSAAWLYSASYPSDASMFPRLFGGLLVGLGCVLAIDTFLRRSIVDQEPDPRVRLQGSLANVWLPIGLTVVYLALLESVGFVLLTPVFFALILWTQRVRPWMTGIGISVATTLALFIVFEIALDVPLPEGPLQWVLTF